MLAVIGRLIVVLFAMAVAALASLAVIVTLGLEKLTHAMHGRQDGVEVATGMFDAMQQGVALIAGATLIPPMLMVLVGEVGRIRSWLYYVIGGGAALAAIPLFARLSQAPDTPLADAIVWQLFATAGFAGGLVYWMLAGRNA